MSLSRENEAVCFGSKCPRDMFTRKGMNSFMKYYSKDEYPNISPCSYNVLESYKSIHTKPCLGAISKRGFSGPARFAINSKSCEKSPAPCDYSPTIKFSSDKIESKAPFSSSSRRKSFLMNKNPGPGLYNPYEKERSIAFNHSFGGRKKIQFPVEIKCCSQNNDTCKICEEKPLGDYWHRKNKVFLCRQCMLEEQKNHSKFTRKELSQFSKLRDCSGIHLHEGTTAKIWLVHPKQIIKSVRKEAYLSCFFESNFR
ncbi:uncharacterized protein LOC122511354 isoform X2 [Leptopilina heterotoma]|uniref:uncharacterized protein LOC122511354 isoform X2 n=1 Tax=Leptopilina heterotoma TaxID=63436 RepID=UPI001CAA26FE|nr:uncharacterized protein LOC122511354 isoform X2 [Leptopilina heterotoma]